MKAAAVALIALTVIACERRDPERYPAQMSRLDSLRQIELQPGQPVPIAAVRNPYENNPYAVAEGRRLYNWYNCSGCHFAGGGGIGPPLMDEDWIYGGEPQNILDSIMQGRGNGMPAYRGRLPQDHALKIVAYVRSLSRDEEPMAEAIDRKEEDTQSRRVEEFTGEDPQEIQKEQEKKEQRNGSGGRPE